AVSGVPKNGARSATARTPARATAAAGARHARGSTGGRPPWPAWRSRSRSPVPARFRPLRRPDRDVRRVSRNRPHAAPAPLLRPAARRREGALPRPRPVGRPPGLALDREPALVRPVPERDDPRPLHRATDAGVRPLAQAAGALLPVR